MKLAYLASVGLVVSLGASSVWALADLKPERVHPVDQRKTQKYIRDGLFVGGDKAIDDVIVRDIRRAANPGFERIVIDLDSNRNGEPVAIPRPPYYQVSVAPEEKRIVMTLWGQPKLTFDAKKVMAAFKKSPVIRSVNLLPILEDNSWTFVFELKADHPVEIFELSNPVRIIMDVRTAQK